METQFSEQLKITEHQKDIYFFTNNNSMRVYLSKDALMCNECMDTKNFNRSFANIIENGLLITHKRISADLLNHDLNDSDSTRPLILKLDFLSESTPYIPAIIINNQYECRLIDFKEYDFNKDIVAFVIGQIPFGYVSAVCFENDDDRVAFNALLQNVHYPKELYEVGFDILGENTYEFDIDKMRDSLRNFLKQESIDTDQLLSIIKYRDKFKGILHAALYGFNQSVQFYDLNFDPMTFRITNDNVNAIFKLLKAKGIQLAEKNFLQDNTPFPVLLNILEHIQKEDTEEITWMKEYADTNKDLPIEEIVGYSIALKLLIQQDSTVYQPSEWFAEFKSQFLEAIDNWESNSKVKEDYSIRMSRIADIIDGSGRVIDFIKDSLPGRTFLNGLLVFIRQSMGNDMTKLTKDILHFGLNVFESRATRVLYGALKGTAYLSEGDKNQALINQIADRQILYLTASDFLISDVLPFERFTINRKTDMDSPITSGGFPIIVEKRITPKVCHELLSEIVNDKAKFKGQKKERFIEAIKEYIEFSDDFYTYSYSIPKGPFQLKEDKENLVLTVLSKATEVRELNFDKVIKRLILKREIFEDSFARQPDKWEKLISSVIRQ